MSNFSSVGVARRGRLYSYLRWYRGGLVLLVSLLGSAVPSYSCLAQAGQGRLVTLSERLHFSGEVRSAYMVVTGRSGSVSSGAATWIQLADSEDVACLGRIPISSAQEALGVLFVVTGSQGEVRSTFRSVSPQELSPTVYLTSAELRDRLVERRSALRQLDSEVTSQEERIEALQSDADAIANVSKIVHVEDELEGIKRTIQQVDGASKDIELRKARMQKRPVPLNAQSREMELVQQLTELSKELSATETSALKRISSASGELQQKLQLIEDTRDEHVTLLEEELADLQQRQRR
jgi:hypothetical protein